MSEHMKTITTTTAIADPEPSHEIKSSTPLPQDNSQSMTEQPPVKKYNAFRTFLEKVVAKNTLSKAAVFEGTIALPNEIIPNRLWLGDAIQASSPWVFEKLGISHVVNVSGGGNIFTENFDQLLQDAEMDESLKIKVKDTVKRLSQNPIYYLRIQIRDSPNEDIMSYFDQVEQFINEALSKNQRVLVHCQAGVSRSSTLVIGYLMKTKGMSLDEAYKYVQTCRPIIKPNDGFIIQLEEYELSLQPDSSQ